MTPDEVRALPVVVDVPTAGRCFGLGRGTAYALAAMDELPVPVLRLGRHKRVVTRAALLAALGLTDSEAGPASPAVATASPPALEAGDTAHDARIAQHVN